MVKEKFYKVLKKSQNILTIVVVITFLVIVRARNNWPSFSKIDNVKCLIKASGPIKYIFQTEV